MSGIANAFFGLAGLLFHPFGKKSPPPQPLPQVNRDAADATLAAQDARAKQRGAMADMTNGTTGYEAGASSVGRLVAGS